MTRIINYLFRKWYFPLCLQLLSLIAFGLLIFGGIIANTSDMLFAKVLRNTNLANLIVWSYWWPLIILFAVGMGRVWCMICPMELVTKTASLIGFKRSPPKWLRSGWVITIFYFLILFVGIHILAIHRVPYRMGLYMLILLFVAVITGLIFSRNAFCAYVCPIGHLLGLYARLAPLSWGVYNHDICRSCKDRSCTSERNANHFLGHSCGVRLHPSNITDNTACLLCGQCLKACNQNNPGFEERPNPRWLRRGWFKDLFTLKSLCNSQVAFCLVVSGFVIYEIITEWNVSGAILMWVPEKLQNIFGITEAWTQGLTKTFFLFVVLPTFIWFFPYMIFHLLGGRKKLGSYLRQIAIAFIPIMASMHVLKALLKITSRIPYWKFAVVDPEGIQTARNIIGKTVQLSTISEWREPLITALFSILLVLGVVTSIVIIHKILAKETFSPSWHTLVFYLVPILYGGVFGIMLIAWRFL